MASNAATTDGLVTYAGWIYKEGSLVKNWKKRFVVVKRRDLAYYKTTDHTSKNAQLMGGMRISRVERASNIANGLIIHSMEGRSLKIFMDTRAECDKCYNAIAQWCHDNRSVQERRPVDRSPVNGSGAQPRSPADTYETQMRSPAGGYAGQARSPASGYGADRRSPVPRSSATAAPSNVRARHTGWLEKQGLQFPTWKRRYFELTGHSLTYSASAGGEILGSHRVVGVRRDPTRPYTLAITLDNARELRVTAESEIEISNWHAALRDVLQHPSGAMNAPVPNHDHAKPGIPKPAPSRHDPQEEVPTFSSNIRLELDRDHNPSFIEADVPEDLPHEKPYSPKAPGTETIRRMRIEQHLLVDSDDEEEGTPNPRRPDVGVASSAALPVVGTKHAKLDESPPGPCCCIVM